MDGPPVEPEITEELPLPPEYRALLDRDTRQIRDSIGVAIVVAIIFAVIAGFGSHALFGRVITAFSLGLAALALLVCGCYWFVSAQALQRHARARTYLSVSGDLWIRQWSGTDGPDTYDLHVGRRVLPLPAEVEVARMGIPIWHGDRRADHDRRASIRGVVAHSSDGAVIFSIMDAKGRTLYRPETTANTRQPRG